MVYAVAKEDRDYESRVEVTATDQTGLNLRLHSGMNDSDAVRRVLWQDLDDARCFAVNYTGEPAVGGPGLTWLSLSRALLHELRADGEVEFGLANESVPHTGRFATFVGPEADANLELSRRRAAAVREELLRRLGPAVADRLDAVGFGEARPRADNETLEGRAANRRVELVRARR